MLKYAVKASLATISIVVVMLLAFRKWPNYKRVQYSICDVTATNLSSSAQEPEKHTDDSRIRLGSSTPAVKIYVYDLPPRFNDDIKACHDKAECYDTTHAGYGETFSSADGIIFRNTWHGLLELTVHQLLLRSAYRTRDPEQADVFYIPYYAQMLVRCTHHDDGKFSSRIFKDLHENITALPYFTAGKPHFITLGMPEAFGGLRGVPAWVANVLYIVLEVGHNIRAKQPEKWLYNTIVAPYQAIGHFTKKDGGRYMDTMIDRPRRVHVFLAAAGRPQDFSTANDFRNVVLKSIPVKTSESFAKYYRIAERRNNDAIMFKTSRSCAVRQAAGIVEWMQNSVFCLQPPGDTVSRKSFYDSVISGCIPVLFELRFIVTRHVTYPFDTKIDYSKFTVTIPDNATVAEVLDPYRHRPAEVKQMQRNLARVAKYLQYNDISTPDVDVDAFHLLMDQVGEHFGFVDKELLV